MSVETCERGEPKHFGFRGGTKGEATKIFKIQGWEPTYYYTMQQFFRGTKGASRSDLRFYCDFKSFMDSK